MGGGARYCLDVHGVWDSRFTSNHGGPESGQKVQVFQCYESQLNQRRNLSGDINGNQADYRYGDALLEARRLQLWAGDFTQLVPARRLEQ